MSAARYRIYSPAGDRREDGSADVEVGDGAFVLASSACGVLRVPFGHIAAVTEPEPFLVRITLADGTAIELSRLGVMRTQLLAELRDGRGDDAARSAAALGHAAIFTATIAPAPQPAEIRVYDDAVLIIADGSTERISFSFVRAVEARDYTVTMDVTGRDRVVLSRLGRQTSELAALLGERLGEARGRTAAFLGSLLPGLDPMALREAAALLRDGVAVPVSGLDLIHPDLASTLLNIVTLPARRDMIAELARRTDLALGFRQLTSIRRPAIGVTPWHDHAVTPHIGEHESPGGSFGQGFTGMLAAGIVSGGMPGAVAGPFGYGYANGAGYAAYGDYWAFRALGIRTNVSEQRPMASRADVTRGRLTPATEDLNALTATGEDPTVLAFALGSHRDRVVYEVLNHADPMTLVYRVAGADAAAALAAINRALDDSGFQAPAPAQGLPSPLGQAPHDERWPSRIAELLG